MAQRSPWGLLDPQKLDALGKQALQAGVISPDEAASHLDDAASMGLVPPTASPSAMSQVQAPTQVKHNLGMSPLSLSMALPAQGADPYVNVGSAQDQQVKSAADALKDVKNAFMKNEQDDTSKRIRTTNKAFSKDPDQLRYEMLSSAGNNVPILGYKPAVDENGVPLPGGYTDESRPIYDFDHVTEAPQNPIVQQKQGLDKMQDLLRIQGDANKQRNETDLTPLARLADAWSQKNPGLSQGLTPPENSSGKFMAYADEIQKRRADIQKAVFENQKNLKGGTTMDQLAQILTAKQTEGFGDPRQQGIQARIEQAQWTRAHTAHEALMGRIARDPSLRNGLGGYNTLDNALALITKTKSLTPQQLQEVQQKIFSAMGTSNGGSSLGDERAQMYLKDIGQDADRVIQYFSGVPVKISKHDPLVNHIREMAQIEQGQLQEQRINRLNELVPGSSWIYAEHKWPDLNQAMDDLIAGRSDSIKQKAMSDVSAINPQGKVAGAAPAKKAAAPKAAVAPDVQAYATKHGITVQQAQTIKNKRTGGH